MSEKTKAPKSDFGKCVGDDVVVFLADTDTLSPLELPIENGSLAGRLVGVDRPGLWLEPRTWYDDSIDKNVPVRHVFLKWENVLGLTRSIESEKFSEKKEYRGLRPRH